MFFSFVLIFFLFFSYVGVSCIMCLYSVGSGMLYFLESGFMFVYKFFVYICFDEIFLVNFVCVVGGGGFSWLFDFEVEMKLGVSYVFSSIEK